MKIVIQHQEKYSRLELLARSFFGFFYIAIPHLFFMFFYSFWVSILQFITFFSILLTAKYPKTSFDAVVGYLRWGLRVNASLNNLVDGYPPFGPSTRWEKVDFDVDYPEKVTRKRLLFIAFLGWIAVIPHMFVLYFRAIVSAIISFFAWFAVLFTGEYPESMHAFQVGTFRLSYRVTLYLSFLYFKYPEFSGDETEIDRMHMPK